MKNTSYAASRSSARERPSTPPKGHSTASAAATEAAAVEPRLRASSSVAVVSEERAKDDADRERWWCWRRPMSSSPPIEQQRLLALSAPGRGGGARQKGGGAETARGGGQGGARAPDLAGGWHMAVAARRAAVRGEHDSWLGLGARIFGIRSAGYLGRTPMGFIGRTAQQKRPSKNGKRGPAPAGCSPVHLFGLFWFNNGLQQSGFYEVAGFISFERVFFVFERKNIKKKQREREPAGKRHDK